MNKQELIEELNKLKDKGYKDDYGITINSHLIEKAIKLTQQLDETPVKECELIEFNYKTHTIKVCSHCSASQDELNNFCSSCGAKIKRAPQSWGYVEEI